jgi:hypothetical protein
LLQIESGFLMGSKRPISHVTEYQFGYIRLSIVQDSCKSLL